MYVSLKLGLPFVTCMVKELTFVMSVQILQKLKENSIIVIMTYQTNTYSCHNFFCIFFNCIVQHCCDINLVICCFFLTYFSLKTNYHTTSKLSS